MRRLAFATLIFASCVAWALQPPRSANLEGYAPEEEDAIPKPPVRRVMIEEEGPPPVRVPRGCYYVRMDDLARAAAEMRNPALKATLNKYVVAFDRITDHDGKEKRVCPVPLHREAKFPVPFGAFELNEKNEPQRVTAFEIPKIRRIDHYEELTANEADTLLKGGEGTPSERAAVAEQIAAAGLLFFDTARDFSKRRGTPWDKLRADTDKRLADVRLKRLRLAADTKDWTTVRSLGGRMATLYVGNVKLLEDVFAARLAEGTIAAASENLIDLERARELLTEFESRFPGSANPAAENVRTALKQQAEKLYKKAVIAVRNEDKEAQRLLRTIETIDVNYPGLRDLQGQLKGSYSILYVGMDRLPTHMSPYAARSDSDRMAVELMFEGLMDAVPDAALGTKYVPALAAKMPSVSFGAREVRLVRPAPWAGLPQQYADAADVAGTIRLMKGEARAARESASGEWLLDQPRVEDQSSLRIGFTTAHPYPLSLLTFKVLPTRHLAAGGKPFDDAAFARQPSGTGPYMPLANSPNTWVANPAYGRRPGKIGQPFIKEIRFVDTSKKQNLPGEFRTEQLHLLPDVPTADLAKFAGGLMQGRATVVTAVQNRRVWGLAVNHRRPGMRSVALRRGLAAAIDRETILNSVYRSGFSEFHKSLTGPYPAECWAVPKSPAPVSLFNRDLAGAKFGDHNKSGGVTILRLAVLNDPRHKAAAEMIKRNVEAVSVTQDGKVQIEIDSYSPADFDREVYGNASFDLAYVPFDYPDDWYPFGLAANLDPAASTPFGRNVGGYADGQANTSKEDAAFIQTLAETKRYADVAKLTPLAFEVQRRFVEAMPFVPLWQLDRHMVISNKLQISFDDETPNVNPRLLPPTIFTQVGRWKLD